MVKLIKVGFQASCNMQPKLQLRSSTIGLYFITNVAIAVVSELKLTVQHEMFSTSDLDARSAEEVYRIKNNIV
jgi:hypothetical protein